MRIAVAHVAEGADAQVVFLRDDGDEADHLRQLAARDGGVFENSRGCEPSERVKGAAARGGELVVALASRA